MRGAPLTNIIAYANDPDTAQMFRELGFDQNKTSGLLTNSFMLHVDPGPKPADLSSHHNPRRTSRSESIWSGLPVTVVCVQQTEKVKPVSESDGTSVDEDPEDWD